MERRFGVLEAASRATEDRGEPTLTTTCSAGGRILRGLVHHFRFRLLQFESLQTGVCGVFFCFFAPEDAVIYSNSPYSTRGCIGRSRYCTLTFDALTLRLTFPGIFVGKGRSRSRAKDKSRDDPLHFTGDPLGTGYAKKKPPYSQKKTPNLTNRRATATARYGVSDATETYRAHRPRLYHSAGQVPIFLLLAPSGRRISTRALLSS